MLSLRACKAARYLVLCSLDVQQPLLADLVNLPMEPDRTEPCTYPRFHV